MKFPAVRVSVDFVLLAYGQHMPSTGTTHCICCMWDRSHVLHECISTGLEMQEMPGKGSY